MGLGVRGFFTSALISNAIVGIWLTIIVVRDVGLHFSRSATKDLLRYGVPLMASWAAAFLTTYGGQFFLQAAGSSTAVGLYAMAFQFGFLMSMVTYTPFMQGWDPKRFLIAKRADRDEIYAHAFILLNVLVFTVSVGIALFVDDMLRVMTTAPFWSAAALVPLVLAAFILQAWAGMQDVGILVRERTEFVTLANWVGAAVALVLYWKLIPTLLGWGAAIATFTAFAVRFAIVYWASQRLLFVRYRWAPVLRMASLSVIVWAISRAIPVQDLAVSLSLRALLFVAFLIAVWNIGVLSPEDRAVARETLRKARGRIQSRFGIRVAQRA
jgi:O-antigen/teichoic acid export membrane protein